MIPRVSRRAVLSGAAGLALAGGGAAYALLRRPAAKEWLLLAGSPMMNVMTRQLAEAFTRKNPSAGIVVEGGGSTAGLTALKRGAIDIACMSRDLDMQHEDGGPTRAWLIAKDSLAIIVHPDNPLGNLPTDMVRDLFAGTLKHWPGVPDLPVEVMQRPDADSLTQVTFNTLVMHHVPASDNAIVARSQDDMLRDVAQRRGAIGFVPMHMVNDTVKAVAVNGVEMKAKTVLSGRYPYVRPLFFVTHGPARMLTPRFIAFARSDEGQQLLQGIGLIRVV